MTCGKHRARFDALSLQENVEFGVQFLLIVREYCVTLDRLILVVSEFTCVLALEVCEELRELARATIFFQLAHESTVGSIGVRNVNL